MAIKLAHDLGCWNVLKQTFKLHSVDKCVEEATRRNKDGKVLVRRSAEELAGELTLGAVNRLSIAEVTLKIGAQADFSVSICICLL